MGRGYDARVMRSRSSLVPLLCAALPYTVWLAVAAPTTGPKPPPSNLLRVTEQAIATGTFAQHMDYLDNLLLTQFKPAPNLTGMAAWEKVLADEVALLAIAQSAVLHQATPDVLAELAKSDSKLPAFLKWLFGDREALEAYLMTIKPENEPAKVFPIWSRLWNKDPADGAKYKNLALACAVVFDKPLRVSRELDARGAVDVDERYDYYRANDKANKLKTDLAKLPASELIWVVDAPVPTAELEWALKNVRLPRDGWGRAYGMVEYRMAKIAQGGDFYDKYTLAEILKKGGTCGDQAYFAAQTAKASGIPAIMLVGEGQRGGHAWFAFKATQKWNMNAGRYQSDQYVAGYATDPQTRHWLKDHMLNFLADSQRHTSVYDKASRLAWLAGLYLARGQTPPAGTLLELAVATGPRNMTAWNAYLDFLQQTDAPKERWKAVVQQARYNFRGYPDMLTRLDKLETETVLDANKVDDILKSLRTQVRKLEARSSARSDLILETVERHIKLLRAADGAAAALTIYDRTLKEFGDEVPVFEALAVRYFKCAQENKATKKALDTIEAVFRKYYSSAKGDFFSRQTQVKLLGLLAGFYQADGQAQKAASYQKKAADLDKRNVPRG
jgi:hypothetical protein